MTEQLSSVIQDWSKVFMQRSGHDFRRFMGETGLSFSQVNILMRLFHRDSCDVSGLGEDMGFTSAAASQAAERLVQMGLIERSEDPSDRRSRHLSLTAQGRNLVENAIRARSQWVLELANALDAEQQKTVYSALSLLTKLANKTQP